MFVPVVYLKIISFLKNFGIVLLLLIIFLFPLFTHTAKASVSITLDNTSSGNISWQHTTGDHPGNTLLLVGITQDEPGTASVTYGGQNLTLLRSIAYSTSLYLELWYLKNPPVGTNTIMVNSLDLDSSAGAATYYNVDVANTFGEINSATGINGSTNVSVNATPSQLVIDTTGWLVGTGSPGNGQTLLWTQGSSGANILNSASSKPGTGGDTAMTWNEAQVNVWGAIAVALNGITLPTPTPTPVPLYSISGTVYVDTNGNQHMDNGEQGYSGNSTITITNANNVVVATLTTTTNGSYTTGASLPAGTYTVSYTSLPQGYYMTYPLSGSPPSFTVTLGGNGACQPTTYNDEVCK